MTSFQAIPAEIRAVISATLLLLATGCGTSITVPTSPTAPSTPPATQPTNSWVATPIPLSPDTPGGIVYSTAATAKTPPSSAASRAASKSEASPADSTTSTPAVTHWFYLVNGYGAEKDQTVPPQVLTVVGPSPSGAPSPNGGDQLNLATLGGEPYTANQQLWKAVASGKTDEFYLRSAQSFETNTTPVWNGAEGITTRNPNMMVGYGATTALFDIGYDPDYATAIYWNQRYSPTGDTSDFQRWSYNTDTAQITNLANNQQLWSNGSNVTVGAETPYPTSQWYPFPNYSIERAVALPNASPPFPAFAGAGEEAAYDYMNSKLFPSPTSAPNCKIEGTDYTGIRCEYSEVTENSILNVCASQALNWETVPSTNPLSYNGVTISSSDWSSVTSQLYSECLYAASVQSTYSTYNTIASDIFSVSSDTVASLANDIGLSETANVHIVPITAVEGTLYTLLNIGGTAAGGVGGAAAGIVANMMESAVNTALASSSNSQAALTSTLVSTYATLQADLGQQLQFVIDGANSDENNILSDWGRLSVIGPLALQTGYGGLAISADQEGPIEQSAEKGYNVSLMQALMAASAYDIGYSVGDNYPNNHNYPDWDSANYYGPAANFLYTYGSATTGNYNQGWFYQPDGNSGIENPSQTVVQTDIIGNGAIPFEMFNGINGWKYQPMIANNIDCAATILTLFNATPNALSVTVLPQEGVLAAPGINFQGAAHSSSQDPVETTESDGVNGTTGSTQYNFRPYGYLPIFTAANGKSDSGGPQMTMYVYIYDTTYSSTNAVLQFAYQDNGCTASSISAYNIGGLGDGYFFTPFMINPATDGAPQGMWVTVARN